MKPFPMNYEPGVAYTESQAAPQGPATLESYNPDDYADSPYVPSQTVKQQPTAQYNAPAQQSGADSFRSLLDITNKIDGNPEMDAVMKRTALSSNIKAVVASLNQQGVWMKYTKETSQADLAKYGAYLNELGGKLANALIKYNEVLSKIK